MGDREALRAHPDARRPGCARAIRPAPGRLHGRLARLVTRSSAPSAWLTADPVAAQTARCGSRRRSVRPRRSRRRCRARCVLLPRCHGVERSGVPSRPGRASGVDFASLRGELGGRRTSPRSPARPWSSRSAGPPYSVPTVVPVSGTSTARLLRCARGGRRPAATRRRRRDSPSSGPAGASVSATCCWESCSSGEEPRSKTWS